MLSEEEEKDLVRRLLDARRRVKALPKQDPKHKALEKKQNQFLDKLLDHLKTKHAIKL